MTALNSDQSGSQNTSVSVVIPLYNGARWIDSTLDHIAAQETPPLEVIVVDDGSSDDGAEKVEARVKNYAVDLRLYRQPNRGVASARNFGIRASQGTLVILLDQDDVWPTTALRALVEAHREHPEIDGAWGSKRIFLEPGDNCPKWLKPELLGQTMTGSNFSSLLLRRESFERIGYLDEKYAIASDTDWFARAREAHLNFLYLPEITVLKRIHGENHSSEISTAHDELTRALHASLRRRRTEGKIL